MIYISPNVGHAFFGFTTFALATIAFYDLAASSNKKTQLIDKWWPRVLLTTGLIYFVGLVISLTVPEMTNVRIGQGQHMALAVFILATSILCFLPELLAEARVVQLVGFAIIMLIHTHAHAGAPAWVQSYHRLLFVYALTLAALFFIRHKTANPKVLYFICGVLYICSLSLFLYTESAHTHVHTVVSASAVTQPTLKCATIGNTYTVTFDKKTQQLPTQTAKLCDVISIINNTDQPIEIEGGEHENHVDYPLVTGNIVGAHGSITVQLTRMGELKLHDHISEITASPILVIK